MNYRKSHNDYWVEPQVTRALENGCNILEADIQFFKGKVLVAHAWKPLESMYLGSLEDYLAKMKNCGKDELWVQIEFKTADKKMQTKLKEIFEKFNSMPGCKINYLIYGGDKLGRGRNARAFYDEYKNKVANIFWYRDWIVGKDIETIDLFNKKYEKLKQIIN